MIPGTLLMLAIAVATLAGCGGRDPGSNRQAAEVPASAPVEPSRARPLVFIDAGHGGEETGGVGVSGAVEKDLVLSVSRHLRDALVESSWVDVQMSRDSDEEIALVRRPRMANAANADLFISLHMNWSTAEGASGIETYYLDAATDEAAERLAHRENLNDEDMPTELEAIVADLRLAGNVAESRALARRVHGELLDGLGEFYGDDEVMDRGVRTALFAVLVRAQMPAVLVELCFLSNSEEEQRARTRAFQQEAAQAMAEGIIGFLRDQGTVAPPDPLGDTGRGQ